MFKEIQNQTEFTLYSLRIDVFDSRWKGRSFCWKKWGGEDRSDVKEGARVGGWRRGSGAGDEVGMRRWGMKGLWTCS